MSDERHADFISDHARRELCDLAVAMNAAKRKVLKWADGEAKQLRLVQYGQSPHWGEYQAALIAFYDALEKF